MIVTPVTTKKVYLNPELAASQADLNRLWEDAPWHVQSTHAEEAEKVLALLNSSELTKPSALAGLSKSSVRECAIIALIDEAFDQAIKEYRQALANAMLADQGILMARKVNSHDFAMAVATGAAQLIAKAPNITIVKQIATPLLASIGAIYGMVKKKSIVAKIKKAESSINRNRWFSEVSIKEELRVKNAVNLINQRVKKLKKDIEDIGPDLRDDKLIGEMRSLKTLMEFLSPETPFEADRQWLQQYGIEDSEEEELSPDEETSIRFSCTSDSTSSESLDA
ncbi:MAG: hypothetical protein ACSNEK_06095 [Parachlamydiaceae bacterium]